MDVKFVVCMFDLFELFVVEWWLLLFIEFVCLFNVLVLSCFVMVCMFVSCGYLYEVCKCGGYYLMWCL